jgi:tetratricopeptide (TPR) repeat protein
VSTHEEVLLIARLLFFAGRVGDADRLLRPLVRAHPERADLLSLWARIKHTQGQLTEAIRTYQKVQSLTPFEASALDTLDMLSRVALHPEAQRREVELELTKNEALQRTHKAHLELERAFRLAARHKFTSAVEICERIAELHKTSDPALYKLALLEKALFLEGIGQFDGAIQTLERLGSTRGFEGDADRLKSLARTYERRGSSEDLQRAMKVYGFLYEQTRAAEFLSRMARIALRQDQTEEAERLEKRFIESFMRAELELALDEVLDAAALCYVPLSALRTLAPPAPELKRVLDDKSTGDRKRALVFAIMGEYQAAVEIWSRLMAEGGSRPEDTKYFADAVEQAGDAVSSRALYLAALSSARVADVFLLGKVLAIDEEPIRRLLVSIFQDPEKRVRTYDAVKQAAKAHQLRPDVWHTLARYEALIGMENESARHRQKAEALSRVKNPGGPRIGHVQVAAVYDFQGRKQGLVHEIWASRYRVGVHAAAGEGGQLDEGSIFGNVASDMMRDIQNVFVAVRTFVEQKFPHLVENLGDYRYVLKVTKDDEPSGGNSAGIAVALAFVSVFLQKPVPQDFAITGSLVADSSNEIRLHRISDVDHKALGVYQRRLSRLIVPAENRAELEASHIVPRLIWESRVSFAKNLTQVMKLVFGDDLWEW